MNNSNDSMYYRVKIFPDKSGYVEFLPYGLDGVGQNVGSFDNKKEMDEIIKHLSITTSVSKTHKTVIVFDNRD